jgi:hypothetical protein
LMTMVCSCLHACNQWMINVFIDCMHACNRALDFFLVAIKQIKSEFWSFVSWLGSFSFFGDHSLSLSLSLSLSQFFSFLLLFAFALFILFIYIYIFEI